jgi:Protein of unknown function (DUF3558)
MTTTPNLRTHRPTRRLILAATAVLAALALSSCGSAGAADSSTGTAGRTAAAPTTGSGPLAAEADTLDPCALLTEADLTAIVGAPVTLSGPATEQFRGRHCDYTFTEQGNPVIDEGQITVSAWHGSEFFTPGLIGPAIAGIGDEASDDSEHGVVIFRAGEDVVQVHVLSTQLKSASLQIARQAARAV